MDSGGTIYFNDSETISRISSDGDVVTIGGLDSYRGNADGTGVWARFHYPYAIAPTASGDLYVADSQNDRIRLGRPALSGGLEVEKMADQTSGLTYRLRFSGTASSYTWRTTRKPAGSAALLSSTTVATPTIKPDVADRYEFELVTSDGVSSYIGQVALEPPRLFGSAIAFAERTSTRLLTIALTEPLGFTVTANWATADGSAVAGRDYVAASGSLTFAPGETSKAISIETLDDAIDEADEYFVVQLEDVVGVQNGGPATVTLRDDDPTPAVSISDAAVIEGDFGSSSTVVFNVTLAEASEQTVWCTAKTVSGSASADSDFISLGGKSLTFYPGELSKTVAVSVVGDTEVEGDETFFVNLTVPSGGVIADGQGVGTILNDDLIAEVAPEGLTAMATSTSSVAINWSPVIGAKFYRVYRRSSGTGFAQIGLPAATGYIDYGVSAGKSYLYKVRATNGLTDSADSAPDLATTIPFTEASLTPGVTTARATHLSELRSAANAVRQLAGLPVSTFTDPVLTTATTVKAVHVTEVRAAVESARRALGLPSMAWTDTTVQPGETKIKTVHMDELRNAVR